MKKRTTNIVLLGQIHLSLLLLSLFLTACGGGGGESPFATARVGLTIKVPSAAQKVSMPGRAKSLAPAPAPIAAIGVSVLDAEGLLLASTRLSVSPGEEVTVTLDVPAGRARKFTVQALDAAGTVLFQGEASADLTPGRASSITIQMTPLFVIQGTLTLDPTSASVPLGGTQLFTVTLDGLTDNTVVWSVNDVVGGNETIGTITPTAPTTAVYAAPNSPPNPNPVVVKVASKSDPTLFATATVTIRPAATISISPTIRSLPPGQTQRFTATVTGLDDPSVVWSVNDIQNGNATVGTITQENPALYTAPNAVPNPNSVTIKAASASDPAFFATATVTLLTPSTTVIIDGETGADGADCGSTDAPCKTITQGLALAKSGQTLLVAAGTYTFDQGTGGETAPLTMKPGVNIQGAGAETTILHFNGTNDPDGAGILGADNAALSGFTIQDNDSLDVHLLLAATSTIIDNRFIDLCDRCISTAVRVRGNAAPTLTGNTFGRVGAGLNLALRIEDTAAPFVSKNTFSANRIGIQTVASAAPKVEGNTVTGNQIGVSVEGASAPDLGGGAKGSIGGNILSCNADADLIAFHTISARSDTWDHVPPKAGASGNGIDLVLNNTTVDTANAVLAAIPCRVKINAPSNGALVRGTVSISAAGSDPSGLVQVDYDLDGTLIGSGQPTNFGLQFNSTTSQVQEGAHTLTATSVSNARPKSDLDSIRITIDNTPPAVGLTFPRTGTLLGCGNVTVTASASDANGISQVEFFAGQSIGIGTEGPAGVFTRTWTPGANGIYTLTAVATDRAGNTAQSAGVTVQVSCLTSIQISPPSAVIAKDKTQAFTLALTPSSATNADVVWSVNGIAGGRSDLGTISSSGLYKPPAKIPADASGVALGVTVEAVSRTDSNVRDAASVALTTGSKLTFGPNLPVTQQSGKISTASSGQRSIGFFKGTIEAVWTDGANVLFSESSDGTTWSIPVIVGTGNVSVSQPALAAGPDGSVYVAYHQTQRINGIVDLIQLSVRRPGKTFESLGGLTHVGSTAQDPTLAVSPKDGSLIVAWSDLDPTGKTGLDIFLQRIGVDSTARRINTDQTDLIQKQPVLATGKNGEIYLVWIDQNRLMATASFDNGKSFLEAVPVNATNTTALNPTIAAAPDGTVSFAWEDRTVANQPLIFFNLGDSSGGTLNVKTDASHVGTANQRVLAQIAPSIASDDQGGIYIALAEIFDNDAQILLAKSTDKGKTFIFSVIDDDTQIVQNKSNPSLAVDGAGRAFAIWTDGRLTQSGNVVFFARGE